jgi:hypothetical protein
MIRDDEINARLQKLSGRQVIFISDSCHSGTITRAFGKPSAKVKKLFLRDETRLKPSVRSIGHTEPTNNFVKPLNHVIAYSAVSPSQLAIDGGPQKGGVFTNAFTRAIRGQADRNRDGKTTHAEVLAYVRSETQAHCDKNRDDCESNNGRLTPQLDANPKWMATDITSKDTAPPSFSSSASDTMQVAQTLDTENTAQLRLQMLPSTTFRLGEKMQVNVSSQRTGYLFVLDIDSAGKMTVLFPNKYSEKRNRRGILKAQQTVKIPDTNYGFDFLAQEPVGQGLLLTLLVEEKEPFVQGLRRKLPSPERGFAVVQRTSQVQSTLARLHQQLRKTIVDFDGVGRPIKWSMVGVEYEIKR